MTRYEVYVGQTWRGTVEASSERAARRIAKAEGLWRRGEGRQTVLQRVAAGPTGKVTSRTAQDRTKTGQLGRR